MKNKIILSLFVLFFCASLFLFTKIKYRENILVMVPSSLADQIELLQQTPFSNKLFVVVSATDTDTLNSAVETVKDKLKDCSVISESQNTDKNFILSYYYNLPYLWTEQLQEQVSNLITKENLQETSENNVMLLFSPEGNFFKDIIPSDPIGIVPVILENFKKLNFAGQNLDFTNGYFTNDKNNTALLLYNTNNNEFDRSQADKIINYIKDINGSLPQGSRVFSLGAARYTQENNSIIVNDVKKILIISILLIFLVFLVLVKDKYAIFVYTVPLLVLIPSAAFTFLKFGFLSGITLGFGSILMGLAVDYSVYVYYSFKSSNENIKKSEILKKVSKPVILSGLTSIMSFFVLYFCDIILFKQLAYFAVFGLIYAVLIALLLAPIFYKVQNKQTLTIKLPESINCKVSIILIILIVILGLISLKFIKTDFSLESLNSVSKQCLQDRKIFDEFVGYDTDTKSMLFVGGENKEEILFLSQKISNFDILNFVPSKQQQEQNLNRWKQFWTEKKVVQLKKEINSYYEKYGIDTSVFNRFYNFLKTAQAPKDVKEFDITTMYNPFIKFKNKEYMIHFVDDSFTIPQEFKDNKNIVLLSQKELQSALSDKTIKTIFFVTLFILLLDFFLLTFSFKNVKLALVSFIPILVSVSIFTILSSLFSVKLNLFSLFCLPLIIGLSVDYVIFIVHQYTKSKTLYPSMAVAVAALSSLAGFGSLIFANHTVLFSLGFALSVGITVSGFVSVYVMPNIIKKVTKILPMFLIFFLIGCSSVPKTNNIDTEQNIQATETQYYQGEMDDKLFFTASINKISDRKYRIITLNELGTKLLDTTLTCDTVNTHYKIKFLPKTTANKLSRFYITFLFHKEYLIADMQDNKILYNNKDKTISFWSQNEFGN